VLQLRFLRALSVISDVRVVRLCRRLCLYIRWWQHADVHLPAPETANTEHGVLWHARSLSTAGAAIYAAIASAARAAFASATGATGVVAVSIGTMGGGQLAVGRRAEPWRGARGDLP